MGFVLIGVMASGTGPTASPTRVLDPPRDLAALTDEAPIPTQSLVTVSTQPGGLSIYVDGVLESTPYTLDCGDGTIHGLAAPEWEQGNSHGYPFAKWLVDDLSGLMEVSGTSLVVHCPAAGTAVAEFDVRYRVEVLALPYEVDVRVDGYDRAGHYAFWCSPGERHFVVAPTPQESGSVTVVFASWSDGGAQAHEITCNSPMNLTATFRTEREGSTWLYPTVGTLAGGTVGALAYMVRRKSRRKRRRRT